MRRDNRANFSESEVIHHGLRRFVGITFPGISREESKAHIRMIEILSFDDAADTGFISFKIGDKEKTHAIFKIAFSHFINVLNRIFRCTYIPVSDVVDEGAVIQKLNDKITVT